MHATANLRAYAKSLTGFFFTIHIGHGYVLADDPNGEASNPSVGGSDSDSDSEVGEVLSGSRGPTWMQQKLNLEEVFLKISS